ncbi:hypothetical protein NL108_016239 [Boleophthalmus pectinirostris]|nr:leukemia inhibitory factor receptor isoform X2 [Boleophthalmus pectinirostris]KAJ0065685.1 hypothetical protein NL108_016239 [Boleophthalmus pectinirostris]
MYECEWCSPYKDCIHYVHFGTAGNEFSCGMSYKETKPYWTEIRDECVFQNIPVDIWVETSNCTPSYTSPKTRVTLREIIKYAEPHNISVEWSLENMTLQWEAPERKEAAVQIRHRANSSQTWNNISGITTVTNKKYTLMLVNLEKTSVQQLQMRHRSTIASSSLWSNWANVLTVPIEFTRILKTRMNKITAETKTQRNITLKWKPVNVNGENVDYLVEIQYLKDCSCNKHEENFSPKSYYRTAVSFSALNLSVRARNSASSSPPALFHVPPENPPYLTVCSKNTSLTKEQKKRSCRELYELRDGKVKEDTVIILKANAKVDVRKKIEQELKEYLPYLYFEHQCKKKSQHTTKKCIYYREQGIPVSPPQAFTTSLENSGTLSWRPIPTEEQRGFITHYSLCIQTISEELDCRKIKPSLSSYTLKDLKPGTKYNISLAGVTEKGEGPKARVIINTPPGKPYLVWVTFGLLIGFFVLSTSCSFIFTRIKNQVFPPVPTPVITGFSSTPAEVQVTPQPRATCTTICQWIMDTCAKDQLRSELSPRPTSSLNYQDLLERKELVDKVILVQNHSECCLLEETEKNCTLIRTITIAPSHMTEEGGDEEEDRRSQTGSEDNEQTRNDATEEEMTDPEQIQTEIALLIYRNGLVFDVNADCS